MANITKININGTVYDVADANLAAIVAQKADSIERNAETAALNDAGYVLVNVNGSNYKLKVSKFKELIGANPTVSTANGEIALRTAAGTQYITPHDPSKMDSMLVDASPELNSSHLVTSGGVYDALTQRDTSIAAANTRITNVNGDINRIEGNIDDLNTDIDANTAAISALETSVSSQMQTLSDKVDDALDEVDGKVEAAEGRASNALNTAVASITEDLTALETRVDGSISTQLASLSDEVDTEVARIDRTLASAVSDLTQSIQDNVTDLQGDIQDIAAANAEYDERITDLETASMGYVDGHYEDGDYVVFTHDNIDLFRILKGGGGGGGGGGGSQNNAVLTVTNTSGWVSKTISQEESVSIEITWSSIENELPTGMGTMRLFVGSDEKATWDIEQGVVTKDVTQYINMGKNTLSIIVSDTYGNSRTLRVTVRKEELLIETRFNSNMSYSDDITFTYTPYGAMTKTVHFKLDGVELPTVDVDTSGRQQSLVIPKQTHGSHSLDVWFTADIGGADVPSNHLYLELICTEDGNHTSIITTDFNKTSVAQYSTVSFKYGIYNPDSLTSDAKIYVNGTLYSVLEAVDRTKHDFSYRADAKGTLTITIEAGVVGSVNYATKTVSVTVAESDINAKETTEDLVLHLTAQGRSNNEPTRAQWSSNGIEAQLTGFNYTSNGWQKDSEGADVLRLNGDARVMIPYKLFGQDFRGTGKTIEIEFGTSSVMNYETTILSCLSGGRGLVMTPQLATLSSEQTQIYTQYKDDEHLRVSLVVEKSTDYRLMYCYIDGVMSGAVRYESDDDFQQIDPVNITIGSSDCTTDIYGIRIYDNNLTSEQILDNWIIDTQDADLMLDRYSRNNIYDAHSDITIENLPDNLPYIVIKSDRLSQNKQDKITVEGYYIDPKNSSKSFWFSNAQFAVQGTSSEGYYRKNYKIKFKGGFRNENGVISATYELISGTVPVSTFCFKADVASSEGANNVILVKTYDAVCPYKTPAQLLDSRLTQGIIGIPCVMFWENTTTNVVSFLGKYNFNYDKSSEGAFGFQEDDESWEVKNNNGNRVIFKSIDYAGALWQQDFEARFPDTDPAFVDNTQLKDFAEWVYSTDTTNPTNATLPSPVTYQAKVITHVMHEDEETGAITYEEVITYEPRTYTTDSAEYRLAKFRAEAPERMEQNSALFYYIFTELFLMADSRAKNMFPSFMGAEIA